MELSRKGREAIVLGLVFLGEDTEEEKDYRLEKSFLWTEGLKPHAGHPSPGVLTLGRQVPLAALKTNGTYCVYLCVFCGWGGGGRSVINLDTDHEEHAHTCLFLGTRWRK